MGSGDVYKPRIKISPASLGASPENTKILRGDLSWQVPSATVEISSIEDNITLIAWNTYSQDIAFDDIYIDDFTDTTGVDTANSTGTYDSGNSLYKSVAAVTSQTVNVTTSQINCSTWGGINSVAVTQSTPGSPLASAVYHAVSFDGGSTYKAFQGGTWNTVNTSTTTWTKAQIEAMTKANWEASGGWSTSINTINWAYRLVSIVNYLPGASNTSETYATATMSSNTTPSPNVTAADNEYSASYAAWIAFDRTTSGYWHTVEPSSLPHWISYNFGSGNDKCINKFRYNNYPGSGPKRFVFQGFRASDSTWVTLLDQTGADVADSGGSWTSFFTFNNYTAYQGYRLYATATWAVNDRLVFYELQLVEATTETSSPTFTQVTFNYDIAAVPLSLISNGWEASVNDPTQAYCVLDVEPVDAITLNTDLLAYASIDNGAHYEQITLEATPFREIGVHDYVRGDLSGITARTDKTIRIKITSANSKVIKLHAWAIGVKY